MTVLLVEGWEHGVATLTTNGGGLAGAIVGTPTVQATIHRTGDYALQINPTAATAYYNYSVVGTTTTVLVGRVYVRFDTWPGVDNDIVFGYPNVGAQLGLKLRASTHQVYARYWANSDGNTAAVTLELSTWYRIDYRFDISTGSAKIDFSVNGVAATQSTLAQATSYFTLFGCGVSNTDTLNMYLDDLVVTDATADYPIGAGAVLALRPDGDGTHVAGTNIMEDQAGADINGTTVTAYSLINGALDEFTTYLVQLANGTTNYAEVTFGNMGNFPVSAVQARLGYRAATASANTGGCIVRDGGGGSNTVWGAPGALADYSENSPFYKRILIAAPGGTWDYTEVNALTARMGYSDDANPDPYWLGLVLEVAIAQADPLSPAEANQAQRSDAAIIRAISLINPDEGTQAQRSDSASVSFSGPAGANPPITGILDNFNRANESPLAAPWGAPFSASDRAWQIVTNQAVPRNV